MNRRQFLATGGALGAASLATGAVPGDPNELSPRDGDRDVDQRDTRWKKFAPTSVGTIIIPPHIRVELETVAEELETRVQLHSPDPNTVYLSHTVKDFDGENSIRTGGITELTADQADALAESLHDCAEIAREEAADQ